MSVAFGPAVAGGDRRVGHETKAARIRPRGRSTLKPPHQPGQIVRMKANGHRCLRFQRVDDIAHEFLHGKVIRTNFFEKEAGGHGHCQLDRGLLQFSQGELTALLELVDGFGNALQNLFHGGSIPLESRRGRGPGGTGIETGCL
ncbi:MAG: hypothetical protein WD648_01270 [Planctomycetaceae bacterium]